MPNDQDVKMNFYAVIPSFVLEADIEPNAKILYGHISALCNREGKCWASNEYLAQLFNKSGKQVSYRTVQLWLDSLLRSGFIGREYEYEEGKNEIKNRVLYIPFGPLPVGGEKNFTTPRKKFHGGGEKIFTQINTSDSYLKVNNSQESKKTRSAWARDGEGILGVEKWITCKLPSVKNPWIVARCCENYNGGTELLEEICDSLAGLADGSIPAVYLGKQLRLDDIQYVMRVMDDEVLGTLVERVMKNASRCGQLRCNIGNLPAYLLAVLADRYPGIIL